jgi:hypothetical protein
MTDSPLDGRLPVTVVPRHYELKYTKIDLDRHVFDGALTMVATVPSETVRKSLLLHCLELQIMSCSVICEDTPDESHGVGSNRVSVQHFPADRRNLLR